MSALLPSDKQPWALENSSLCNTAKGLSPRALLFLHLGTRWIFSALICIASSWRMVFASTFSMAALRWHCLKFVSQAWRALASFLAQRVVVTQRRLGNNPMFFPGLLASLFWPDNPPQPHETLVENCDSRTGASRKRHRSDDCT